MPMLKPADYIAAARVPATLLPQSFGVWEIYRRDDSDLMLPVFRRWAGFPSVSFLARSTSATMHLVHGETVMEDSLRELRQHLPIWLRAHGSVLVSGLGLGCVVRGLLASPRVDTITCVEIDASIIRVVGPEFASNPRVRIIKGDALTIDLREKFDCAWHDIWTEGDEHLQVLHARLIKRFYPQCGIQGAWQLPRITKRGLPDWVLR